MIWEIDRSREPCIELRRRLGPSFSLLFYERGRGEIKNINADVS
jgi:hypothetical protein